MEKQLITLNIYSEDSIVGKSLVAAGGGSSLVYKAYVLLACEQQRLQRPLELSVELIYRHTNLSMQCSRELQSVLQDALAITLIIKM
jgi:hypothetical protein